MANVVAGKAYIDIRLGSIERFKRELLSKIQGIGRKAGHDAGQEFGSDFAKTMSKELSVSGVRGARDFSSVFASAIRSDPRIAAAVGSALVAAVAVAAPLLGGVLGGAILGGTGLAAIAAGIALVADRPEIKAAGKKLKENLLGDLREAAQPFVKPLLDSIKLVQDSFNRVLPNIKTAFASAATYLVPLTGGITKGLEAFMVGFSKAVVAAGPLMKVISDGLTRIGVAVGEFLTKLASDPEAIEGMTKALGDLIGGIVLTINWFGDLILSLSRAYAQFKAVTAAIANWWSGTIVPSLKRAVDQAIAAFRGFSNYISSLKSFWSGVWGNIVNTVVGAAKAIWNTVAGLGSRLYSAGADAMRGFFNGLASMAGSVIQKAKDIANSVADTVRGALQIFSPSRVMEKLGRFTGEGFAKGLDKSMPDLNAMAKGVGMPAQVGIDFGGPKNPQMNKEPNAALHIEHYHANENVNPWRQAEDWYFMVTARGGLT